MPLTTTWGKYFIKETLTTSLLFLVCFFGIYVLIDYTNHASSFHQNHNRFDWQEFFIYYSCEFVLRSEVLIPFAVLLGTIKTLCKLNSNNEIIAMLASGVNVKTLLLPFFAIGLFFTLLMYANNEFLLPLAAQERKYFDDMRSHRKNQQAPPGAQHVVLNDQSLLLYQNYDTARDQFYDVYWIRSTNDIYRMEALFPYREPPEGTFVDHILRDKNGIRFVAESNALQQFPDLTFNRQALMETVMQPEGMSLSALWQKLPEHQVIQSEKEARIVATFHRKLATPWLCLLAVIATAPWCIRFSRNFPVFLVYACSIFGLVVIYIVLDASHVLARRQIFDPLWAIWTPTASFLTLFGWRYFTLK